MRGLSSSPRWDTELSLIHIFESVIEQLKGDNLWVPKSVYEQAAKVLPEILFRFTYKLSLIHI